MNFEAQIREAENDIAETKVKISSVEKQIQDVEDEIKKIESRVRYFESQLEKPFAEWDTHYYYDDEKSARAYVIGEINKLADKKSQLRDKKSQLRDKKSQLRDKEGKLWDKEEWLRYELKNFNVEARKLKTQKLDMQEYALNELPKFMSRFKINREASFSDNCLEFELGTRLTEKIEMKQKIVFLVAVSGAGKTRKVYEELYQRNGIFFTCSKAGNGGSRDFENCIQEALRSRDMNNVYFKLLLCSRFLIVNYLLSVEKFTPPMLLLAQIYPERVFGHDIFDNLFAEFVRLEFTSVENVAYDPNLLVAVDDIQFCFRSAPVFLTSDEGKLMKRTVFAPIFRTFCHMLSALPVIYTGTNMDYAPLKDYSSDLKELPWDFDTSLRTMTRIQVQSYACNVLKHFQYSADEAAEIAELLSENTFLVGGRPQFTAYIMSSLSAKDTTLENVLEYFYVIMSNKRSMGFSMKNWDSKKDKLIGKDRIAKLVLTGLSDYILNGIAHFDVYDQGAAELVQLGIGYCESIGRLQGVVFLEKVQVQALFALIPIQEIANEILRIIRNGLNLSPGFQFEYLVMLKYYCDSDPSMPFEIVRGSLLRCLSNIERQLESDGHLLIFPDNYAGPDIILTCTKNGKTTIKFIQLVLTKGFDLKDSLRTVDYNLFYCSKESMPLKHYVQSHLACLNFFTDKSRYVAIEKYIVYQGEAPQKANDDYIIISKDTCPYFFNSLGLGYNLWDKL